MSNDNSIRRTFFRYTWFDSRIDRIGEAVDLGARILKKVVTFSKGLTHDFPIHGDDTLVVAGGMNYEEMALRAEEGEVAVVELIERLGFRVSLVKTQAIWFHSGRKKRVLPPAGGKISVGGKAAQIGGK